MEPITTNQKNTTINSRTPIAILTIALVITSIVVVGLGALSYRSYYKTRAATKYCLQAEALRSTIMHLDDELTMSLQLAVFTGDPRWEKRYRHFEPQLNRAIKKAIAMVPKSNHSQAVAETNAANSKLIEMEHLAFELVRQGRMTEGKAILASDAYQTQKKIYAKEIAKFTDGLIDAVNVVVEREQQLFFLIAAWILPLLLIAWLATFHAIRSLKRSIARRNEGLLEKTVMESEEKLNAMLGSMPDQLAILDKNLNILWANETAKRLFGSDLIGQKCYHAYHERETPCDPYPCFLLKTFEDGKTRTFQKKITDKEGNTLFYYCTASVVTRDENGKPALVLETIRNLTEQRRTEEALAITNRRLQSVLDASSQVAIIATDSEGIITLFNTGAERMLGFTAEEMIGKQTPKVFHLQSEAETRAKELSEEFSEPIEGFEVFVARALRDGYEERQWTYVRKDGVHLTVNLVVTAVQDENSKVVGFLGMASDVTKQKQAEDEMRRSEARFRDVAMSMSDWVWECDPEGHYTYCSDQVLDVLGYSAEEILGKTPFDLMPKDEAARVKKIFCENNAKHEPIKDLENRNLAKEGHEVILLTNGVPMFDPAGNFLGYRGVDKNITDRKRAEQEIRDYAAALERNNQDLAELNEAVEMANRAKSEFLANMSHEIRTPMTAILGFSEVLIESISNQEQLDAAQTIKQNGEYLIGIINDILDLSKIEAGKMEIENVPCSPRQILSEVVSLMRVRANAKNLPLEIEYDGPIPNHIQSDPTRLRQILINLLGNAIKFTEVGKIRLVTRLVANERNSPKLQFEIIDSGIGMTDEQIGKLFKPFSQVDASATRMRGGTGLGLAISKRLAENLGGDITVKSTLDQGSTFTVTVRTGPLDGITMLEGPSETQAATISGTKRSIAKLESGCRVLLAEDGPDNQRLITFLLKKAGAQVEVAENGQIAYDLALKAKDEGNSFDVILMDMQMPVMDGYTATTKLRQAGYTGAIVALTAHAMSTDRDKCLNAGCNDYVIKPIDKNRLISVVAAYVSEQNLHTNSKS